MKNWNNTTGTVGEIERAASSIDSSGNVIVVTNNINSSNNTDILITKYTPEGGLWQTTYNGVANGNDYGIQLKINNSNEIFIASAIQGPSSVDSGTNTTLNNITISTPFSSDTVKLEERFENSNNQWFLANKNYIVDKYQVNATVFHNLPLTDSIISFWPRHSSSSIFPSFNTENILLPRERIVINSLNNSSASLTGYVYKVYDSLGNHLGWWPFDTTLNQVRLEYSILSENLLYNNTNENEVINKISVYPTPSNDMLTIELNLPLSSNISIGIHDLSGKLVIDV